MFISPIRGALASIHFREQQSENSLSILPIKISQLHRNLGLSHIGERIIVKLLLESSILLFLLFLELRISLSLQFSTLFFFDLFQRLQEELLDVRPLVQYHLTKRLQILTFSDFQFVAFGQGFELLILLFDNLLILEFDQFPFFFKIGDNLAQV